MLRRLDDIGNTIIAAVNIAYDLFDICSNEYENPPFHKYLEYVIKKT